VHRSKSSPLMSALGHPRPRRASYAPMHVRFAPKASGSDCDGPIRLHPRSCWLFAGSLFGANSKARRNAHGRLRRGNRIAHLVLSLPDCRSFPCRLTQIARLPCFRAIALDGDDRSARAQPDSEQFRIGPKTCHPPRSKLSLLPNGWSLGGAPEGRVR
jgi:hypothetical protein